MKSTILAAIVTLALIIPAAAQQTPTPTLTQKATDAASSVLNKVTGNSTAPAKVGLININNASADDLDKLPSIGAARSKAIIAGRPYKAVDELLARKIVPADAYAAIKDKIAVK
jgi:competence protein ComEA